MSSGILRTEYAMGCELKDYSTVYDLLLCSAVEYCRLVVPISHGYF
jgi:hypothetical protein